MSTNLDRPMAKPTARSARAAALVFAAVLIAAPVLAQRHASPRGGGSGGGGGGFSGGGHRSAGPSASAPSSRGGGGGGGGNWSGDGHRPPGSGGGAPHRPPGYDHDGGHGHGYGHGYYGGSYYSPYYYPYYGFSFGFGYGYPYYYSPYYYSPYYYGYGYYPYSYGYRPYYYGYRPYSYYPPAYSYGGDGYVAPYGEGGGGGYVAPYGEGTAYDRASFGAVAVRVKPKNAEVYVDGRYVGATGSFDGFPSYLWVPPGQHRIEVVQVGYANLAQEIEVGSGQVVEIDQNLQRGESVRPAPPTDRYSPRGAERAPYPDNESYEGGEHRAPAAPTEPPRQSPEEGREPGRYEGQDLGGLFLEVRPDDASVYLDGRFVGTGRDVSTATEALRLVPGQHRLQVIHPNYTNQERTVEVGAGEEKRVEVYLGRGAGI